MDVIHEAVKKYDKNLVLKDKQREALTYVVKSKCDLVVSLPVGYGKCVIFHLRRDQRKSGSVGYFTTQHYSERSIICVERARHQFMQT